MGTTLTDGMESPRVSDTVKRQIFVNQLGICAHPECSARIIQDRTTLGECAHIIPRVVGSHPREDYTTPLSERNQDPNLLYLCERHHKFADNRLLAEFYPASKLRQWKEQHEAWAASVSKSGNTKYLPPGLADMFANVEQLIGEQLDIAGEMVSTLLNTCYDLLRRNRVNEATLLLYQVDRFLINATNTELSSRADLLGAILLIHNEQFQDAKERLLHLIRTNPENIDALLEYIQLCDNAPEPNDRVAQVQELARQIAPKHPGLALIDIMRSAQKGELIQPSDDPEVFGSDVKQKNAYFAYSALFYDSTELYEHRNEIIERWIEAVANSSRPHLFRVVFSTLDVFRKNERSPDQQVQAFEEALMQSSKERAEAAPKDPLVIRDEISWLAQEIRLAIGLLELTGHSKDIEVKLSAMFTLIKKCYFDNFINNILVEVLSQIGIGQDDWKSVINRIQESGVKPSDMLLDLLFLEGLHYDNAHDELEAFIETTERNDLIDLLKAIAARDLETVVALVNASRNPVFGIHLLRSLQDLDFVLQISEQIQVDIGLNEELLFARVRTLAMQGQDEKALTLVAPLLSEKASPAALETLTKIAYRNRRWHLFIPSATALLRHELPHDYRGNLTVQLAIAYFELGDDSGAAITAETALNDFSALRTENAQELLHILGQSLTRKGKTDEACTLFQKFEAIERSFELLLQEADLYLRSTMPDKHNRSLSLILNAFEKAHTYDDDVFFAPLGMLIELANQGYIPHASETIVEENCFIQLEGFENEWFYVGENENTLGAHAIRFNSPHYQAVFGKGIGEQIEWPADKYSHHKGGRTITKIEKPAAYLSSRAHEVLMRKAATGDGSVWSVQVIEENGNFDISLLEQFVRDRAQPNNDFFENFRNARLPFSMLCSFEGSLVHALGKISSEQKGFIYLNNGSPNDIERQYAAARNVLAGAPCYIDGLATFMLAESELLDQVIAALPNLNVATSVISLLRETATHFDTSLSRVGMLALVNGRVQLSSRSKESDEAYRLHLLRCAELLDNLPGKVLGRAYPEVEDTRELDHLLPEYVVDAFRYSQDNQAYLLTDDAYTIEAYRAYGETAVAENFSSLSLVKIMAERGLITWEAYYRYFFRLSLYRYHLLPLSVNDFFEVVLPSSASGLITPAPQKIRLLNLPLTISQEYGVDDATATSIVASVFTKIIFDEAIPPEIADEIFALIIGEALSKRSRRTISRSVFEICAQNLRDKTFRSQSSTVKLRILNRQLTGFAQGIDPLVIDSSMLLRVSEPKRKYDLS